MELAAPRTYLRAAATGRHPIPQENAMLGVGEKLPEFKVVGVKPKFMKHEENGASAFEPINNASFPASGRSSSSTRRTSPSSARPRSPSSRASAASSRIATPW
jgi:hypothetical protein